MAAVRAALVSLALALAVASVHATDRVRRSQCYQTQFSQISLQCQEFAATFETKLESGLATKIDEVCSDTQCLPVLVRFYRDLAADGCTNTVVQTPKFFQAQADVLDEIVCSRNSRNQYCLEAAELSQYELLAPAGSLDYCQKIANTGCCFAAFSIGDPDLDIVYPAKYDEFQRNFGKLFLQCEQRHGIDLEVNQGCASARIGEFNPFGNPSASTSPASLVTSSCLISVVVSVAAALLLA